jgi:hypothetical protein
MHYILYALYTFNSKPQMYANKKKVQQFSVTLYSRCEMFKIWFDVVKGRNILEGKQTIMNSTKYAHVVGTFRLAVTEIRAPLLCVLHKSHCFATGSQLRPN